LRKRKHPAGRKTPLPKKGLETSTKKESTRGPKTSHHCRREERSLIKQKTPSSLSKKNRRCERDRGGSTQPEKREKGLSLPLLFAWEKSVC